MAIIKKSINNNCWRGCGEKGTPLRCWWEGKLVQPHGEQDGGPAKTKSRATVWFCNPTPGHLSGEKHNPKQTQTPVSIAILFAMTLLAHMVKNLPAVHRKRPGSTPELVRSSGEGNSYSLQFSCLKNPMDRDAWWDVVCSVAKSWTWLKQLSPAQPVRLPREFYGQRSLTGYIVHGVTKSRICLSS